ncbi:PBSX family phage terminase large subunit [Alicyclobacillus fastidiosus]|uniref:PBSX family phage terminase large subunit n=1 Tax=Alicyclobacillus fastidiosus TaxID=392011 RepID=A0ABV5AK72_9BACL|nr:PBSX family phage terminase large subunit [Alicyclobacillus fastidiosus]WEH09277.1 PBSX family phage terminase large subunit [Alicyclobacillus fastidiosus]
MSQPTTIDVRKTIGSGYGRFWNFKGRYRVVKGGRASKKSATAALWFIYNMMKYPKANTLVIRKTYNAHKDSTYAQLKWAINRLGVRHLWDVKKSPLEITYKPTGQKILFRGLDDPMSITSITVDNGYLCWCWFEEAYQVLNEDDFDKIDMSIRGDTGELFKQLTLTFNPWNEKHWLNKRFFQADDPNILAMTTNYTCNEFLGDDDRDLFEWMKQNSPRRYRIEGLGDWGIAEGAVFENWEVREFDWHEIAKRKASVGCYGLDFGFKVDPSAFIAIIADPETKELYFFDEHYQKAMMNDAIAEMIKRKGYAKELITADSADQKSIEDIRRYGIGGIIAAQKGPDSIRHGIQRLQQYKIIVHPDCENTIIELSNYVWATGADGSMLGKPIDDFNHILDAARYATERLDKPVDVKTNLKRAPSTLPGGGIRRKRF